MTKTTKRRRFCLSIPLVLKARVRMLESMVYRLYTNQELTTGQMNELIRIVSNKDPNYFERKEDEE